MTHFHFKSLVLKELQKDRKGEKTGGKGIAGILHASSTLSHHLQSTLSTFW